MTELERNRELLRSKLAKDQDEKVRLISELKKFKNFRFPQESPPTCSECNKKIGDGGYYFRHHNDYSYVLCLVCYPKRINRMGTDYWYPDIRRFIISYQPTCSECKKKVKTGGRYFKNDNTILCLSCFITKYHSVLVTDFQLEVEKSIEKKVSVDSEKWKVILQVRGKPELSEFDKSFYTDDHDVPALYINGQIINIGNGYDSFEGKELDDLRWKLDSKKEYIVEIREVD